MKPTYEISVAGQIIDFGDRLLSISLSQERDRNAGIGCENVEIILDDSSEPRLMVPPHGRALRVKFGYEGQPLVDKGIFIVDESEISGPPNVLKIRAQNNSNTPHDTSFLPLITRMNRSWQTPLTVQKLVTQIAIDHGLFPVISPELASIELPHIDQANMSDLELLSQYVCRVHDAYVLPQDSKLLVLKNGSGETVSGKSADHTFFYAASVGETLDPEKIYINNWRSRTLDFTAYQTVKAAWYDYAAAQEVEETVGDGSFPILRLPFLHPDAATANAAARTALARSNCFSGEIEINAPGVPILSPGEKLSLLGAHPDLDNVTWYCRRVEHTIDRSGFWTRAQGERLTADLPKNVTDSLNPSH